MIKNSIKKPIKFWLMSRDCKESFKVNSEADDRRWSVRMGLCLEFKFLQWLNILATNSKHAKIHKKNIRGNNKAHLCEFHNAGVNMRTTYNFTKLFWRKWKEFDGISSRRCHPSPYNVTNFKEFTIHTGLYRQLRRRFGFRRCFLFSCVADC